MFPYFRSHRFFFDHRRPRGGSVRSYIAAVLSLAAPGEMVSTTGIAIGAGAALLAVLSRLLSLWTAIKIIFFVLCGVLVLFLALGFILSSVANVFGRTYIGIGLYISLRPTLGGIRFRIKRLRLTQTCVRMHACACEGVRARAKACARWRRRAHAGARARFACSAPRSIDLINAYVPEPFQIRSFYLGQLYAATF